MKLIVGHSRTKRELTAPFELCGSRDDLESLAHQILAVVHRSRLVADAEEETREAYSDPLYGWVTIMPSYHNDRMTNLPPMGWD